MKANPDETLIQTRMPVWRALSELFLDTELTDADHRRLGTVLAASPYSVDELEAILRDEVYPVCRSNLLSVAGAWAGFDDAWLRRRITPRLGRRSGWWGRSLAGWVYRDDWRAVRACLMARRG